MNLKVTLHTGKGELVSLKGQCWAFWLGVCIKIPFNIEVTIKGDRGMLAME